MYGSDTESMTKDPQKREESKAVDANNMKQITAFGSLRHNPTSASALLRARAAAAGATLREADKIDLVASTIGAECWMFTVKASSLNQPVRHGSDAVAALAAILARAAGLAEVQECPPLDRAELDTKKIQQVEQLVLWVNNMVPGSVHEVFRRAAADLSAGTPDLRFEAMAGLLNIIADTCDDR